jgi:hypothetical protein
MERRQIPHLRSETLTPASKLAGDPETLTPASKLAGDPETLTPASKLAGDPEMLTPASKLAGDPEMWGTQFWRAGWRRRTGARCCAAMG